MKPITIPLLVTAAVGAMYIAVHKPYTAPQPQPQPQPNPATDPATLLAQAAQLGTQTLQNPASVDPKQIGLIAMKLRAVGYPREADSLEALGPQVCAARGMAPNCWGVPVTGTPAGPLPAELQQEVKLMLMNPNGTPADIDKLILAVRSVSPNDPQIPQLQQRSVVLVNNGREIYKTLMAQASVDTVPRMRGFVDRFRALGLVTEAAEVEATAKRLEETGVANAFPSALPPKLAAALQDYLVNPAADPAKIDALVVTIQSNFPGGFLGPVTQLQQRAKDLRALGR